MSEEHRKPTYKSTLKHHKLNEADMKTKCSVEAIEVLAPKLIDWKLDYLRLGKEIVESINSDFKTEEERKLKYLQRWSEQYGHNATYEFLAQRILEAGFASIADEVCKERKKDLKNATGEFPWTRHA